MKFFKRAGSAALAAAILAAPLGIYADAAVDKGMEEALTYVKQRLDIDEAYSEFQQSSYTEYGKKCYRFSWNTPDYNKGWNVSIKGSVITNINKYDWSSELDDFLYDDDDVAISEPVTDPKKPHFSKIPEAELLKKAKDWMKIINPNINSQLETKDDSFKIYLRQGGTSATLSFYRVNNGIPVAGQSGSISINKDTGDLVSYNLNWIGGAAFAPVDNAISVSTAMASYKKEFPTELVYVASYDYDKKQHETHLVYRQKGSGEIDAFTGKLSTFEDYKSYDELTENAVAVDEDCDDDANPATGGDGGVTFTPNEIKKLEEEDKLVKAEDSMKQLEKDGMFLIPKNWEITRDSCNFDNYNNYYLRYINFTAKISTYVDIDGNEIVPLDNGDLPAGAKTKTYSYSGNYTINAETGEVLNFYCNDYSLSDTSLNVVKTTATATSNLKKLLGKNYSKFEMRKDPDISSYHKHVDEQGQPIGSPTITSITFTADRVANGIKSEAENVSMTIGQSGKIKSYRKTFYDLTYPKPDGKLTSAEAYNKFFEQVDFSMTYRCAYRTKDKKIVTALVYRANSTMCVDAFTGERTYWNGSPVEKRDISPNSYSDLDGSKYGKYAQKLLLYGVCIANEDGKLAENDVIDAKTFNSLINQTIAYSYLRDDIKPEDKVTNKLAAKILVSNLYGTDIPSIKGIFKSPFKDVSDSNNYVGYIAIAKAKGLMKGSNGKFSPNASLTRGKALKLICDYLA